MVALPALTPLTTPAVTDATPGADELHVPPEEEVCIAALLPTQYSALPLMGSGLLLTVTMAME